jgi:two-component sensor histidine kinase
LKKTVLYTIVFAFLIALNCFPQFNRTKFLYEFRMSDLKGKVKLVAGVEYEKIKDIYPLIQDTLEKIRKKVFANSSSKEARFLFDKIDISQELYYMRFSKAALKLETCLSTNALTIYDSIYCYGKLKNVFIKLGNLNKSIEANTMYDKLARRINTQEYLNNVVKKSKIYDMFGLNKQAIIEKRREIIDELPTRKNDTDFIASFYNDIGVYFNRLKNSDSAIVMFNKANELITKKLSYTENKEHYLFFKGLIEGNMAMAFVNKGDLKKALPLLKKDIYYSNRVSDFESAFNSCVLLSRCYIKLNESKQAQMYADSALQLCNTLNRPKVTLKLLLLQGELFDHLGQASQAAVRYRTYINLKDSISDSEKEMLLINQQVALDIQNKDLEILEKNTQIQNSKINEEKQKAFRAYLMAGLIILIILIVFLFYTNNNSKKREQELSQKNEQIQKQNKQIEISLKEKELLLREIHHRVKNNLQIISSVINLQTDKLTDAHLKAILEELKLRISSIALTHQMLYQKESVNTVLLQEYIQNLVKQIIGSYDDHSVQLDVKIEQRNILLNIDSAIPLGLLINEIITNAYKHAFKAKHGGQIALTVSAVGKNIELIIKDNGSGLPSNYLELMKKPKSLGFELISILAEQLNAKLEIKNENGAEFKLNFTV